MVNAHGLDSNYIAMAWFSKADLFIEQYKFNEAFSLFDSIQVNYPFHSLADEILYKRAKAMELQGSWERAIGYYEDIINRIFDPKFAIFFKISHTFIIYSNFISLWINRVPISNFMLLFQDFIPEGSGLT